MSVSRTDYLMYGVKLDFEAVDPDKYGAFIDSTDRDKFDLIVDGMDGEYAVAGKVIASSDPDEGIRFTEITPALMPDDPELSRTIASELGLANPPQLKLYFFSHYS